MAGGTPNNSGRVTTQEFYQAQLDTNKEISLTNDKIAASDKRQSEERAAMELRLVEKISGVPVEQVKTNKEEIAILRKKSNINDWAVLITGLVSSAIATVIGSRQ